ncbi:MAG TPA: carboxymuconolactone decarboxylase family protein [Deltaproteobacteria bacterium]|nr:carboxymuconolactone decarboxylase family protein [Deltaproteobacteria bacterium]
MRRAFDKRFYTTGRFLLDVASLVSRAPRIIEAYYSRRVPWALAEKIMLAVTAVHDCRHCARFHGALARLSGVEAEEIKGLLRMEIGAQVDDYERPALQFAQEYAQTEDRPSKENLQELKRFYGEAATRDILLYLRMICVGNLTGNTFDALLERLKGSPVRDSRLFDELVVTIVTSPFLAFINAFAVRQGRTCSGNPAGR